MNVTVIICTYNRANLLKRALNSLVKQTFRDFETIIVDDGTDDKIAELCNTMKDKLLNLKYISTGGNTGSAYARNKGIEIAKGNFILFTDDDCIPAENWVEKLSFYLAKEPVIAGAVMSPVSNYLKLCHNISQFHAYMPGQKEGKIEFIAGANMGFRVSVLKELKGFKKEQKLAVDTELILRARMKNYEPYFTSEAVVIHDPDRTTLRDIFTYSSTHSAYTILLRNQYRFLLMTPFILRSPFLILLMSPLIALKVTANIYLKNHMRKFIWTSPVVYALKMAWCWGAFCGLMDRKAMEEKL